MTFTYRAVVAAVVAVGIAAAAAPTAAQASSDTLTPAATASATSVPASVSSVRARLEALVGTQSDEEIASIANSGRRVQILLDDEHRRIAAYYEDDEFSVSALSSRGPGCA